MTDTPIVTNRAAKPQPPRQGWSAAFCLTNSENSFRSFIQIGLNPRALAVHLTG